MGVSPNIGLSMDSDKTAMFWNEIADGYTSKEQGNIPYSVIDRLFEKGILSNASDVIEIGSGPGTYSLPIASRVSYLECVDSSERMLARLKDTMHKHDLKNVGYVLNKWEDYDVPDKKFDVAVASLCPYSGTIGSLRKMETCASKWCVMISWNTNHGDDISEEIWKKLGFDFDFGARKNTGLIDLLKNSKRSVDVEYHHADIEYSMPTEDLVKHEKEVFEAYGIDGRKVSEIVKSMFPNSLAHFKHRNSIRVIAWQPLPEIPLSDLQK